MPVRLGPRKGFTLVELLTVIAIIAILAAIIFPVFSVVRRKVYSAQCTANLHSLSQALKLYKDDYGVYPEALYGFGFPNGGGQTFLYPQYIRDKSGFHCPISSERIDANRLVPGINGVTGQPDFFTTPVRRNYFAWDSYDGSLVPHTQTNAPYMVHYMRKWTPQPISASDNPRQLTYRHPPDNTVVTWCTYHRSYQGNQPESGSMDLVLFLDGRVKPIPVTQTANDLKGHEVTANP